MSRLSVASLAFALVVGLLPSGCKDDPATTPAVGTPISDAGADAAPQLSFTTAPLTELPDGVRFATAVPFGPDATQVMDVFLPAATTPTAAILYFHGGGFVGGTRNDAYVYNAADVRKALEAGIAWIGVDYRLLAAPGVEREGLIKGLRDGQRSLQFVRQYASSFNIDPARIGAHGNSAGAGIALWLAFHEDMAKPGSADPLEHQSTRLKAIGVDEPQATYDLLRWVPDILSEEYPFITSEGLIQQADLRALLVQFYGLDGALANDGEALLARLDDADMKAYRADVDFLSLLTSDDSPSFVLSSRADLGPFDAKFDLLHHPLHGKALYAQGTKVGAPLEASVAAYEITSTTTRMDFLITHLAP